MITPDKRFLFVKRLRVDCSNPEEKSANICSTLSDAKTKVTGSEDSSDYDAT